MPIRKMGKALMIFKARLSLVISLWLLFLKDLRIPFIKECFWKSSCRKSFFFFFNPFAFQVDEALHKYCSRAGVIGILGDVETYQLAGAAGAQPAAVRNQPSASGGMAHPCPTELPVSCFLLDAELHVGSFSASPCSAVQTSPGVPELQDEKLILPSGPDPGQTCAHA